MTTTNRANVRAVQRDEEPVTNTPTTTAWTWGQSVATTGTGPTATVEIDVLTPGHREPEPVVVPLADARVLHAMLGDAIRESSQGGEAAVVEAAPADRVALRDRAAQAIRDSNGTPEALAWWEAHPQLIPAHVYAEAALAVLPALAEAEAEFELRGTAEIRAAVLREAADIAEALRQFELAAGARKAAQVSENVGILRVADRLRRMADEEQQPTPCSEPNPCEDGELCGVHEVEQAHADGEHEYCGVTCEVQFPTEVMRNWIVAGGIPGTAGMLGELLRRAAAGRGEAL